MVAVVRAGGDRHHDQHVHPGADLFPAGAAQGAPPPVSLGRHRHRSPRRCRHVCARAGGRAGGVRRRTATWRTCGRCGTSTRTGPSRSTSTAAGASPTKSSSLSSAATVRGWALAAALAARATERASARFPLESRPPEKSEQAATRIGRRVLLGQQKWDFMLSVMIGIQVRARALPTRQGCHGDADGVGWRARRVSPCRRQMAIEAIPVTAQPVLEPGARISLRCQHRPHHTSC